MNPFVREEIANILAEAKPQQRRTESHGASGFDWYDLNANANGPLLEQTPRARDERTVLRIAAYNGWAIELAKLLDREHASCVNDLSDRALQRVLKRMRELDDAVQHGFGAPDAPPA